MPVELGSFDSIIGMDWLVKYQAIIVCAEKIVLISWGNETLIVHGDRSNRGNEAHLHLISYTKIHEYTLKGCPIFLANVTTKETEDKSEKKRLKDVSMVRDFPNVFPKDFPGLPLTRHVKFQIDLIPGACTCSIAFKIKLHLEIKSQGPNKLKRIFKKRSKKKAKNKQIQAREGKDQVKSKSKVIRMKKIQLEGLKLPNLKLYYKR
ncbi:hypothetical protein Tco_1043889 [Tanacetum coccineum]|uniref:Reverse transcriptase domain-containing protein n=1 Tax=Tanacetum coccineum TaxID=301880 RepID=A0ABQ5GPL4_9ASTR